MLWTARTHITHTYVQHLQLPLTQQQTCYEDCVTQSALYFAVLEGNVCACGDSAEFLEATAKPLGECDAACPGNGAETCGGFNSYNLYEILEGAGSESES